MGVAACWYGGAGLRTAIAAAAARRGSDLTSMLLGATDISLYGLRAAFAAGGPLIDSGGARGAAGELLGLRLRGLVAGAAERRAARPVMPSARRRWRSTRSTPGGAPTSGCISASIMRSGTWPGWGPLTAAVGARGGPVIRRMAVIVPAADEEEHIGGCLSASMPRRACLYRDTGIPARLIVVLDRCQDPTAAIARRSAGWSCVTIAAGNVGAARVGWRPAGRRPGRAAQRALAGQHRRRLRGPGRWLTAMVAAATGRGAPGAGHGRARARPEPGSPPRWAGADRLRDGHPHVHGANLGIRGGRLPRARRLAGAGRRRGHRPGPASRGGRLRISRTAAIPVVTSVRRTGRAPRGFSSYLRDLSPGGLAGARRVADDRDARRQLLRRDVRPVGRPVGVTSRWYEQHKYAISLAMLPASATAAD